MSFESAGPITIPTQAATDTDCPWVFDRTQIPDSLCSPSHADRARGDGGDVRFYDAESGGTLLDLEVIKWEHDTVHGAGDAEIVLRVRTGISTSAVTVYAGRETTETTQPAADASGGSEGVNAIYDMSLGMGQDPTSGVDDESGNGVDFAMSGGMGSGDVVAGKIGDATHFERASTQYLRNSAHAWPSGNASYNYEFWIRGWINTSQTSATHNIFVALTDQSYASSMMYVTMRPEYTLQMYLKLQNGQDSNFTTVDTFNDGGWHFIEVVVDGDDYREFRVDGVSIGTETASFNADQAWDDTVLGARSIGGTITFPFDGDLDSWAIATESIPVAGVRAAIHANEDDPAGTSSAPDTTAPIVSSVTVAVSGQSITFVFSEPVTIGAGGSGGLTVGGYSLTYSSGDGTDTHVYTISETIYSTDTPTSAYTQPGNGLEDGAGNDLATFSGGGVTNGSTQPAPASGGISELFVNGPALALGIGVN